jgi:hypothetical protein
MAVDGEPVGLAAEVSGKLRDVADAYERRQTVGPDRTLMGRQGSSMEMPD